MKIDVDSFVKQCQVCQQAKHELSHPAGLLQPLPIPQGARQDISMDFIKGLPTSEDSNVILVVVDRFTKCNHFIPFKHPFTAHIVAKLVWRSMFSLVDTKLLMSSSYHPQTDGRTERVNQCLEMY